MLKYPPGNSSSPTCPCSTTPAVPTTASRRATSPACWPWARPARTASDDADFFLVGGAESKVNPLSLVRQCLFEPLSHDNEHPDAACRPDRAAGSGAAWVIGEGATALVFEELEHQQPPRARIYAEVVGFGRSSTAAWTRRHRPGPGRAALAEAGHRPRRPRPHQRPRPGVEDVGHLGGARPAVGLRAPRRRRCSRPRASIGNPAPLAALHRAGRQRTRPGPRRHAGHAREFREETPTRSVPCLSSPGRGRAPSRSRTSSRSASPRWARCAALGGRRLAGCRLAANLLPWGRGVPPVPVRFPLGKK